MASSAPNPLSSHLQPSSGAGAATRPSPCGGSADATPAFRLFLSRLSSRCGARSPTAALVGARRRSRSPAPTPSPTPHRAPQELATSASTTPPRRRALAISLLAHPFSLALLSPPRAWCFLYLFARRRPPRLLAAPSRRETSAPSSSSPSSSSSHLRRILIISALMLGAALVCAHGAFRVPEDLFLDEPEPAGGAAAGLLSFLGGAASSAAAAAACGRRARLIGSPSDLRQIGAAINSLFIV
ncbi:PRA1 family protein B4 [Ananas comosus]|uniref:PRA1 family protein B4 n=1 Tax=Ananas comosus TaxID=4615 RepID=A0A199UWA7_ANACO|nr:PRA1 family protein B4 [Ananas comosus]